MTFGQINYIWNVKRIASALILSVFLYNIIGYYFSFSVLNLENRYEMNQLVKNGKNLQIIRIHKSEIKNVVFADAGNEMSYNGEMYDIKDKSQDGDYIVFHCMNDKNENELLANLDKHIQNNIDTKSSSEKKQNSVSKNILKDYLLSKKQSIVLSSIKFCFPAAVRVLPSDVTIPFFSPPPSLA